MDTVDGQSLTKSSDFTGFKKFLLGCLEALDIDISRFMGKFVRDLVCDLTLISYLKLEIIPRLKS